MKNNNCLELCIYNWRVAAWDGQKADQVINALLKDNQSKDPISGLAETKITVKKLVLTFFNVLEG